MEKVKVELENEKEGLLAMLGEANENNSTLTGEVKELKETVKKKDEEIEKLMAQQTASPHD